MTPTKPADDPDFFRRPAPEGRSRESTIRLDREGRFWHDGRLVERPALARALHRWIARHPDDGRYILTNDYDWTYFTVEDAPFFVVAVRLEHDGIVLVLSDEAEERLDPATLHTGTDGALYARVKQGAFEAKLTRAAQFALAPALEEGDGGAVLLRVGARRWPLPGS